MNPTIETLCVALAAGVVLAAPVAVFGIRCVSRARDLVLRSTFDGSDADTLTGWTAEQVGRREARVRRSEARFAELGLPPLGGEVE